nr:immunoglobulin heavy chain junction region [Mus musculus]
CARHGDYYGSSFFDYW